MSETPPRSDAPETGADPPLRVLNGKVFFNGKCDQCRPYCAAICCRSYGFVPLTDQEMQSGHFIYKQATTECNCEICQRMQSLGIRYALRRLPDGSCVHLDGEGRCSVYENRPDVCRKYSCEHVAFALAPAT